MTSTDAAPRRFRPRALPTLATIVAVAVFVSAGQWQQRRMHDKEALRAQFDAAALEAPVALAALPESTDWNALRYHLVIAAGHYDAHRQVLVDNRIHDGHAGYHVITPLVLSDGRTVLVNRGWAPQGATRAALPEVAPPARRRHAARAHRVARGRDSSSSPGSPRPVPCGKTSIPRASPLRPELP